MRMKTSLIQLKKSIGRGGANMGKYLETAKITMKEQLEYRFNVISGTLLSVFKIILAYFLWKAVFQGKDLVGGYTFNMMLTYYIITAFFMRLNQSESLMWQFSQEVQNGGFTKYVVRPISPIGFFTIRSLTKTAFMVLINTAAFFVWVLIFKNYFIIPEDFGILLWVIFFVFSGLLILIQTNYFISMLSFKLVEIAGFYYMGLNIIEFLSGALVPLSLLPGAVVSVIKYLPYYYVLYFPASLYLGLNIQEIPQAAIIVSAWNIGLLLLNLILYKKLFRYYEGVGA